jgi:hypothetical protein
VSVPPLTTCIEVMLAGTHQEAHEGCAHCRCCRAPLLPRLRFAAPPLAFLVYNTLCAYLFFALTDYPTFLWYGPQRPGFE